MPSELIIFVFFCSYLELSLKVSDNVAYRFILNQWGLVTFHFVLIVNKMKKTPYI